VAAVRVIHEQFDANDSLFKLKTLYRQTKPGTKVPPPPEKPGAKGGPRPGNPLVRGKAPPAAPTPVRGKPAAPAAASAKAAAVAEIEEEAPPKPAAAAKPGKAKKERTGPTTLGARFAIAGGAGIVAGIGVPVALMSNVGAVGALSDISVDTIAVGAFLATFAMLFYMTGSAERRAQREAAQKAETMGTLPDLSTSNPAEMQDLSTPTPPAPPPAIAAAPEPPKAAAPAATPAPAPAPAPTSAPTQAPQAAAAAPVAPEVQEQRVRLLKLLHDCLANPAAKPYLAQGKLDPRNRFGFHLYMLGAGQYCLAAAPKGAKLTLGPVIETALATLGTDAAKAHAFAVHVAEYSKDPKHAAMIRAGAETMREFMRTNKLNGPILSQALQNWNQVEGAANVPPEGQGDNVAIMFTDMVSSVNITQKLGDEGMMKVVQTHNLIVGAVLKTHRGRQVKHTGDGIMAMFPRVSDGVAAAAEIQRQVTEYNSVTTSSPLKLRIGVSAGKPIREGDDYFGTVVQTAARLCAVAQADEIVVPDSIREMPGCDNFAYEQPIAVPLKGFPEPQLVRKVIWANSTAARTPAAAAG
jgi:class 3 adenylate cyclase